MRKYIGIGLITVSIIAAAIFTKSKNKKIIRINDYYDGFDEFGHRISKHQANRILNTLF